MNSKEANEHQITENDLIGYLTGEGSPEVRKRIKEQRAIAGSFVAKWFEETRQGLANPFDFPGEDKTKE